MPRRYTLQRRAELKDDNRARILAAAVSIFRDRGMGAASTLAIAKAADVSPGTVRNHFPDRDDLASAVFEQALGELRPPDPGIFDRATGARDRMTRLATELAAFYERSEPWWRAYEREPELINAWSSGVDRYYRDVDRLMRAGLGPLSGDDTALAVVAAVIGPPTYFALRSRGLAAEDAVRIGVDLVVPWLEAQGG
jgi:AcrR family transcriptional regulator